MFYILFSCKRCWTFTIFPSIS